MLLGEFLSKEEVMMREVGLGTARSDDVSAGKSQVDLVLEHLNLVLCTN